MSTKGQLGRRRRAGGTSTAEHFDRRELRPGRALRPAGAFDPAGPNVLRGAPGGCRGSDGGLGAAAGPRADFHNAQENDMGRRQRNRARRQLTAAMPGAPQRYGCDEAPDLRDGLDGGLLAGLEAGTLVQLAARRSWGLGWLVITNPTGAPNPIRKGPL
ncbi:MAG TPA: hypothetical protein PKL24_24700, partial [Polyangiaceae bacterium]|nr:hypothetical protein [Polyangiaceae bacterium]HOE51116.1 hypothetical protein [Polyangiaceae bacterium]HOH03606.1 hypothetical protein [Polyangiaceae bacterium]HOR37990.1 hypothetical protein [Polyangiaceae bacterium]HPK95964.1 hypothetical protein [Polyangiaceae bacterium]